MINERYLNNHLIKSIKANMSAPIMSLYIPRVFENIDEKKIIKTFETLLLGKVNHVDFVTKMGKNRVYKSAYIHFDYWFNNVAADNFQDKIRKNKEARIVYDDPWFWVVLENSAKKYDLTKAPRQRIDLSGLKDEKKTEYEAELMNEDIISVQSDFTDIADVCDKDCFDYVDSGYVSLIEEENKRLYNELQRVKEELKILNTNSLKQVLGVE